MYKNQHVFYADTVKNKTARIISSIREDNKYVKYNKLPEDYRKRFEIGLENTLPSVQNLIKKALKDTRFCRIQKTSFFRRSSNSIFINTNSDVSSLAHEIFHKLDTGLSEKYRLEACLKADYEKILIENKDVFQYLTKTFSQILDYDMIGDVSFKLEYRGLSDIFAGLSNNQILLGPHHSEEYWQRKNALGAEAWAQFGRMCYNNNDGLKTLKQIFPTFYKTANIILKELE